MITSPLLLLLPVLALLAGPGTAASAPGCGPCDPDSCPPLPASGCRAGPAVPDACGCCSVCAAAEGERCGGRGAGATGRRCGAGLECIRTRQDGKITGGVCSCKSNYEVCGNDGVTYRNGCSLTSASMEAQARGADPIRVQNKGRCPAAPVIVSPPGEVFNVSGSQVFLSCEAVGVPTPILTWRKVIAGKRRVELLPGDQDNLAVQTRGGPEKHEVTGWVLISPLTKDVEGSYECHASNSRGEASATGAIHMVDSLDDIIKKVSKEDEL